MRKSNPTDICDDFENEIDALLAFRETLLAAGVSALNQSLLASLVFHRGFVALESFLSAWLLACINRDSTTFIAKRESKIRDVIKEQFGDWDNGKISYTAPQHLTVAELNPLLDPDGHNVTFYSIRDFQKAADKWLAEPYVSKAKSIRFLLPPTYSAAKAIRNCIAHQSTSSFRVMNEVLSNLPNHAHSAHLRNQINAVRDVGSYLKARFVGKTRVEIYFDVFKSISSRLK